MNAKDFPAHLRQKAKELHSYMNRTLPKQAKDLGVQFFKSRWRAQGWLDNSFKRWASRKRKDKKRPGRAILMNRGRLRNSIRGTIQGDTIVFGTDVPYAKIHNEGGTIQRHARSDLFVRNRYVKGKKKGKFKKGTKAGRGFTFKAGQATMPKRQFIGDSAHLRKIIIRKRDTEIRKIMNK